MKVNLKLLVLESLGLCAALLLALFLPAFTFSWPAGWIFFGLFFGFYLAVSLWLLGHNPGLAQERLHLGTSDQQGWDKLLFPLLYLFPFAWLVVISLDGGRFHWSGMPLWPQLAGGGLLFFSFFLMFVAFRENSFASPVVRIQEDRGQKVISTGPYQYVRHPLYSGIVVFSLAVPLLLGSWYGLLGSVVFILLLARRTVLEERTLRLNLPGYEEYMLKVKYRFVPYLW
jgi:protein-S-isoprenylcysteine O-methyltransferase Ste14